ncbi:hypothetical protein LCGC14_0695590 [marine sediment metagenome]|uniref:Uncharacterized protein n=1 Tax=marine sediment metagenome TaxID=412755 RepID=A0A0F9T5H4_9ZZZZ|nr:MAG: hypothetical protein Lokiarch_10430 [Candidatus Lokiarchaeum sp. GC14_75]
MELKLILIIISPIRLKSPFGLLKIHLVKLTTLNFFQTHLSRVVFFGDIFNPLLGFKGILIINSTKGFKLLAEELDYQEREVREENRLKVNLK